MPARDSLRAPVGGLREAALLGVATGMRTFSGVGALALHGRLGGPRVRPAIIAAAAGERVGARGHAGELVDRRD
jgi:hypothetical protein